MSATSIQWTHFTFNAWIGCAKVSDGCKHCYAEVDTFARSRRANGLELWGVDAERHRTSVDYWKQPERWNRAAFAEAQRTGDFITTRRRVFCASLADVFEDRRDLDPWRADLFAIIERTPFLDWQLLTKRPEAMVRLAPASWSERWPANVWAGATVENQAAADRRINDLVQVPARVRFLSYEPAIGPVSIREAVASRTRMDDGCGIHWCIIGGESGTKARPFDLAWARAILAECRKWGIAPFVKQLGAHPIPEKPPTGPGDMNGRRIRMWTHGLAQRLVLDLVDPKGGDMAEWPDDLCVREFPVPV